MRKLSRADLERPWRLDDLAEAEQPGQPGLRYTPEGTWVPLGMNWERCSPMVQERKLWDRDRSAGGLWNPSDVLVALATCARCSICIGRGFVETELYLYPVGLTHARGLNWKVLCGGCATRHKKLPFGYCLIAHADWSDDYADKIVGAHRALRDFKRRALEHQLIPAWNVTAAAAKLEYHTAHGEVASWPRAQAFAAFIHGDFAPLPLTFTALYARAQQLQALLVDQHEDEEDHTAYEHHTHA